MNFDVAIVGGGIIGAACADSLAGENLRVVLIESEAGAAHGTTAAGMGHIVVMDDSEAQFALTNYSRRLWNELAANLPASCEYDFCGTIWVAADEEEMGEVRRKKNFYAERGAASEILDEKSLREAEPNLREGLCGGLLVNGDSVVYQLAATAFLIERAIQNGAAIRTGKKAVTISDAGVKLEDGSFIGAGKVINAAGALASRLTPDLPVVKRKGHLVITDRYPNFVSHQLVELGYLKSAHASEADSVAFNVQPRRTGQILLGSSRQFGADSGEIDYRLLRRMLLRAFEYMPALSSFSGLRVWTGFRPATPDHLPYIGKCPNFENVYLAIGHEGLGITTALGTARILTDEILERPSVISREPFAPGRFYSEH